MNSTLYVNTPNEASNQAHIKISRLQNLLAALDLQLREAAADSKVLSDLDTARTIVQATLSSLVQRQPVNPTQVIECTIHARLPEPTPGLMESDTRRVSKNPTPMAVYALGTLQVAANAYTQWDRERGIAYGLGNVLTEYAVAAKNEVFGPADQ